MIDPALFPEPRFPIGTEFSPRGNRSDRKYTVTDMHYTFNGKGELVKTRYVCTYPFCGRNITDHDVCETTIAIALYKDTSQS